ncbi:D-beta-D-heptose 1-phosphate adenosyltransferase [Intrasporangium chromatireducens Q5-1]|uniref:D-beta-D-heptose 1-phosphate adenosyltransferase n=1 Tax=Intrasporangium chromatireducens Q5-1 TaxID=584657 RepID=W9GLF5_9MICO|nr:D-beta-D-heptose 1-phosphate adenosyltransferase [Intrasporangium chromatireducens Q5-1]
MVVGDVMLDREVDGTVERFCPDAPAPVLDVSMVRQGPGGAGLATRLCAAPDVEVTWIGPLAADDDGAAIQRELAAAGITTIALGHEGATRRKTRVRSGGHVLVRLDEGGPGRPTGPVPRAALEAIAAADVVLASCYGAGTTAQPELRRALERRAEHRPVVWDPHPRGGPPVPGCLLVSPNLSEARTAAGRPDDPGDLVAPAVRDLWAAQHAAVTGGAHGAWLAVGDDVIYTPVESVGDGDPCGAGDRFAAAATTAIARGATVPEAITLAVARASEWVASGGAWEFRRSAHTGPAPERDGTTPGPHGPSDTEAQRHTAKEVVERVRGRGGTVVATGGCFDVLHAGHLQSLQAARRLGDALVVLLNSDASVRRLKGAGRPVQTAEDRARLLLGLECVDAVAVFDEDDPSTVLGELRPDVWAKGGDYAGVPLTESELVRGWGGRVVLLPYLEGRSTTALLSDAG